jgi:hypothetical protein
LITLALPLVHLDVTNRFQPGTTPPPPHPTTRDPNPAPPLPAQTHHRVCHPRHPRYVKHVLALPQCRSRVVRAIAVDAEGVGSLLTRYLHPTPLPPPLASLAALVRHRDDSGLGCWPKDLCSLLSAPHSTTCHNMICMLLPQPPSCVCHVMSCHVPPIRSSSLPAPTSTLHTTPISSHGHALV